MGKKSAKTRVKSGSSKKVKTEIGEVNVMNFSGEDVTDEFIQKLLAKAKVNDDDTCQSELHKELDGYAGQYHTQMNDGSFPGNQLAQGPHNSYGQFIIYDEPIFPQMMKQLNAISEFQDGKVHPHFDFLPPHVDECVRWVGDSRCPDHMMSILLHSVSITGGDECGIDEVFIPKKWMKNRGTHMCMLGYYVMKYFKKNRFIISIGNNWNIYKKCVENGIVTHKHWIYEKYGVKTVDLHINVTRIYDICQKSPGVGSVMTGMTLDWFDYAFDWVKSQVSRGLDDFDKMKCYWTRPGAKKKNEIWFGPKGKPGMCVMAGAYFNVEDFASVRDPLEMD